MSGSKAIYKHNSSAQNKEPDPKGPLTYPIQGVFGSQNLSLTAVYFSVFGMQPHKAPTLSTEAAEALYGLKGETKQLMLVSPGLPGAIRLIETPYPAAGAKPLQPGPYGIDFYTSNLKLTLEVASAAGGEASPIVPYQVEGNPRLEGRVVFPDDFSVFLIESKYNFPSILDKEPRRAHSELSMLCWVVENIDKERLFWTKEAGLEIVRDVSVDPTAMVNLMAHPNKLPLGAVQVADKEIHRRIELMYYPADPAPKRPDWPIRPGLFSGVFIVEDLNDAMLKLNSATFGKVATADFGTGQHSVVSACSPGGVRFELWQPIQ